MSHSDLVQTLKDCNQNFTFKRIKSNRRNNQIRGFPVAKLLLLSISYRVIVWVLFVLGHSMIAPSTTTKNCRKHVRGVSESYVFVSSFGFPI